MSIMARIGVRSVLLSVVEIAVFFGLSAGYFVAAGRLHSVIQRNRAEARQKARTAAAAEAERKALAEGKSQADAEKESQIAADRVGKPLRPDAGIPVWLWVVLAVGYLLIVTVWWSPGDEKANNTELIALAVVVVVAAIAGGIFVEHKYGGISGTWDTFWQILKHHGRAP